MGICTSSTAVKEDAPVKKEVPVNVAKHTPTAVKPTVSTLQEEPDQVGSQNVNVDFNSGPQSGAEPMERKWSKPPSFKSSQVTTLGCKQRLIQGRKGVSLNLMSREEQLQKCYRHFLWLQSISWFSDTMISSSQMEGSCNIM